MLLAIDTSAGTDVAVVTGEGRVLGEYRLQDARRHAEEIGVGIATALDQAGISADHLTGIVCGMGPGPFTGLRVGVAAARTMAFARGIRLHPLNSHDAIAHEWRAAHPEFRGEIVVATDARRRELALSRYPQPATSATGFTLVPPAEVDGVLAGATLVQAQWVSAAHLAQTWLDRERQGLEEVPDEIIYLRAPDAKPAAPRRPRIHPQPSSQQGAKQ